MKYEPAPTPSKLDQLLEFLAREFRRIAGHTHEEPYWDDLRVPAQAVNPPGLGSDPQWDTSKGGWLFDQTLVEELHLMVQLPHGWKVGSDLRPHVHYEKATSATGSVTWRLSYSWLAIGASRTAEATLSADDTVEYTAGADFHMLTPLGIITASASIDISDMLFLRLQRDVSATADTYAGDARLLEFDIHYQSDTPGSVYLYKKR